jgi:hypothetical protein
MRKKNTKIAGLRTIHHADNLPLYPSHHRAIYRKRKGCRSTLRGSGAPGEIRTPDHQVRSLVLYPAELRARRSGIIPSPVILVNPKSTSRETNRVAGRLAEREGFEPSIEFLTLYSLSRGAPSASRAPLRYLKPEPLFVPEAYSARHPVSPSVFTCNALQRIAQTLKPRPLGHLSASNNNDKSAVQTAGAKDNGLIAAGQRPRLRHEREKAFRMPAAGFPLRASDVRA